MKIGAFFFFLHVTALLSAQNLHKDTIRISEVSISESNQNESSNQVLDSAVLNQPMKHNLGEVLATEANLFVKSYGIGSMATISMRGSGSSHSTIFWNGIQLNSASNGVVDLSLYPTLFIDEVEVDYGNSSLRSGSGGLGGAVQLNNTVEFKKKNQLTLGQDFGSYKYRNTSVKYTVGNSKIQSVTKFLYRTADNNFSYQDLGEVGFPNKEVENASLLQKSLMQSIHYRPKENQQLEAHFWYYDSDRNLPSLMTLSNIREKQVDESIRASLGYKFYGEKYQLTFRSSLLKDKVLYENNRLPAANTSLNYSFRNLVEGERKWKSTKLYTRLNLDFEEAEQAAFVSTIQRTRISAYAEITQQLSKKLAVIAAFREEVIVDEADFFLPSLELNYQVTKAIKLFAKASKNLKYPSLNDLYWQYGGNQELKAEKNQSAELGAVLEKELANKSWLMTSSATAYYSKIDDYIQWQPTSLGYWQAVNLREVEVKGVEPRLEFKQLKGILKKTLRANYTFTQSINKSKMNEHDGAEGKQLIYLPENQVNLSAQIDYKNYFLNYQWQFIGARYVATDNSDWLPYYQLSNVSVGSNFKLKKHRLQATFSVLNLFDLEYQAIQWRAMPNRNYQLGLSYTLQ